MVDPGFELSTWLDSKPNALIVELKDYILLMEAVDHHDCSPPKSCAPVGSFNLENSVKFTQLTLKE